MVDKDRERVTQEVKSDTYNGVCKLFRQGSVLLFENEAQESQSGIKWEWLGFKEGIGLENKYGVM